MADQIVVSENALGYLNATRPWVKFLAIMGFIFIGLMVLVALAMFAGGMPGPAGFGAVLGFVYILLAVLYFMPCLFLYRYGKAIAAIPSNGQTALEEALKNQKSFWKFMGILTVIMLCVYVIGIVAAIAIPAMMGHHP